MANVFADLLHSYTMQLIIHTTPDERGFRLTGPGLLGTDYRTSSALTARILASPEFDQLFGTEKAQRILALVLEAAAALPN